MVRKALRMNMPGMDVQTGMTAWENFTGINLVDDNTNLPRNHAAFATNADFVRKVGAMSKANGADKMFTVATPIRGGAIVTVNDTQYALVANNTNIYAALGGKCTYAITTQTEWSGGTLNNVTANSDGTISITSGTSGDWTSPVYNIGSWCYEISFDYVATVPSGCTLTVKYMTSEDNVSWSSEYTLDSSGIPTTFGPYMKFKIYLTGSSASLKVYSCKTYFRREFESPVSIYSSLSGNDVYFANYNNRVYIAWGGRPLVWDGTTVRDAGMDKPTTAPTLADSGTSGNPSGTYKGVITNINSDGVESEPSAASGTLTVTAKQITWTAPVGPTGTTKRNIYRTLTGGTVYYKVAEIADNTTTSYTDNVSDTSLATNTLCPDDNQVPPNASNIWLHQSYMFYVDADDNKKLWFSKPGNPENVPNREGRRFYFSMPHGVTSLGSNTNLVVSGMGYMKSMAGTVFHTDTTINNVKVTDVISIGVVSQRGTCLINPQKGAISLAMIMENREVGILGPTMVENVYSLPSISRNVAPVLNDCSAWEATAIYNFGDNLYVAYSSGMPTLPERVVLVYNIVERQWQGVMSVPVQHFMSTAWRLYAISTAGEFLRFLTDEDVLVWGRRWGSYWTYVPPTIDGDLVDFVVDTGYKAPKGVSRVRYRYMQLVVSGDSITDSLTVTVVVDGQEETIAVGSKDTWNVASVYGSSYGLGRQDAVVSPPFPLNIPEGRFAGVRIKDSSANPITVYAILLQYEHTSAFRGGV